MDFIQATGTERLNSDPTLKMANKVLRLLKRPNLPLYLVKQKVHNPACPRIFAYVKTHKNPVSARPIVEKRRYILSRKRFSSLV